MTYVPTFRKLSVYLKSRELAKDLFAFSCGLPKDGDYSLKSQMRRASRSVGAQIAESWAKRKYEKHFVSKLTDADAEQMETQHWVECAYDCGYLNDADRQCYIERLEEIGRMLNGMIQKADSFCGNPISYLREDTAEYFTEIAPPICSLSTVHR